MTQDSTSKVKKLAWSAEPGDSWPGEIAIEHRHEKTFMGVTLVLPLVHHVERKEMKLDNERMAVTLRCSCDVETTIDVTGGLSISQRHDAAFRSRCGVVAALQSCICTWPLEVEPTQTGHSEACPAHAMLMNTMTPLKPGQCCARDIACVGSCDVHSMPGALRSISEREKVMRAEPLAARLASGDVALPDSTPPWERSDG